MRSSTASQRVLHFYTGQADLQVERQEQNDQNTETMNYIACHMHVHNNHFDNDNCTQLGYLLEKNLLEAV